MKYICSAGYKAGAKKKDILKSEMNSVTSMFMMMMMKMKTNITDYDYVSP